MPIRMWIVARYRALTGLNYIPNQRAEIGDIVDDLPSGAIKWMLEEGYIELVTDKKSAAVPPPAETPAPVTEETVA